MYEVWDYAEDSTYDPKTRTGGLFAQYINKFLRLKQQPDGWPNWVKTEEDKERYILEYEEKEGIKLDPAQIEKNSGLRNLAKLMLNSFWGKVCIFTILCTPWRLNLKPIFSLVRGTIWATLHISRSLKSFSTSSLTRRKMSPRFNSMGTQWHVPHTQWRTNFWRRWITPTL